LERDLALLRQRQCDLVFVPAVDQMYPDGYETTIDVGSVARPLEGAFRPTHFAGVATVVMKLFQLVPADRAYFGQKDYQQSLVIQHMVTDLNVPIGISVCPIIRDPDGLAMSSRNVYLNPSERERAPALFRSLQLAQRLAAQGEHSVDVLRGAMEDHIRQVGGIELDYIAFVCDGTVQQVDRIAGPTAVLIAARIGTTRLIDNCRIGE
jgi:pantoate--beta-alanine ligase